MEEDTGRSRFWRLLPFLLILLVLLITGGSALAGVPASLPSDTKTTPPSQGKGSTSSKPQTQYSDDFDSLKPAGLKGVSYSTLVNSGKVHLNNASRSGAAGAWSNPFAPLLNIVWGNDMLTGSGQGEPAAGIHPSLFNFALISGNFSIDHTTDGGATWTLTNPPNPHNSGDVTNAWLEGGGGGNALELSINLSGGYDYTCGRSTDFGVTWATDAACGPSVSTPYFDDREYIWVDRNPSSPFHGRVYVTTALFDAGGSGSFNTVSNRWSSDNGVSWNPPSNLPIALVPNNEFALGLNHNEYPSLGISPNGTIGYAWHRGMCCGGPSPINSPNKVMFTRSTDGGVSFPYSTTIVTVPLNQSVPFNATSPFGQRWSDTPNITADPTTNGVFYAVWTAYRTPSTPASAAVYLSKSTDNGVTWSTPVIPYNNPNANIFQGFGWVKVTADHTVHVTYFGGTTSNTVAGQFYVQSTDGGATWTAPFQLNATNITTFASTTDYIADDVSLSGGAGAILAGIEENNGHHARLGTFVAVVGTPTPTATGTPPTNTPTLTRTNTPTVTPTVCGATAPYGIATATGTIVAGTTDTGNHCDDCLTSITLPFSYSLYDQTFTSANVDSNGTLQFIANVSTFTNACLPATGYTYTIFPMWDDLYTINSGYGIFTSVSGSAPNRIFNIEWRAQYFPGSGNVHFEVRLYEGQHRFDVVYGAIDDQGASATVGVQRDVSNFTQYECNTGGLTNGLMLTFTQSTCGTPLPTNTPGNATATPTCQAGGNFHVLIVYADAAGAPTALQSALLAEPGVTAVDLFDATAGTPTLAQLMQYQLVVPFSNNPFLDATTLGNNLADYVDANGVVVQLGFSFYGPGQPYGINGRWVTGNYNAYNYSTNLVSTAFTLGTHNGAHPLMQGVTALNSNFQNVVTLASGATEVAAASNGNSLVAYRPVGGHTTVGVTAYIGSQSTQSGDWAHLIVNAARWLLGGGGCGTPQPTATQSQATPTATCQAGGTPGPWTAAAPYPITIVRYGFAQVGNSFYVIGGVSNGTRVNSVNRYDVGPNTWTPLANIPVASEAPTCAYNSSTNKIYCAEGDTGNSFQIYDIASNTWTTGPAVPGAANRYGASSGSFGNFVYIVGGSTSIQSDVQVYNISSNSWSAGTPAANALLLAGYHEEGQYLYVVGGFSSGGPNKPANGLATSVLNKKGQSPKSLPPLSSGQKPPAQPAAPDANNATTLRLDMSSGTWSTGPAWTMSRADFGLAYSGGKLYAMGGDTTGGGFFDSSNEVDELDVSAWPSGSWTTSPPVLPAPNRQANQAGFTSADGRIWSVGGIDGSTFQFLPDNYYRSNGGGGCGGATATPTQPAVTATATCSPSAGGWSAGAALPTPIVRAVGVYFPADGMFYSVGGRTSDTAGSDFQHVLQYNPGSNTWVQKGVTLPDNQMNNMACGVLTVSGTPTMYCVGGSAAGATTATARVFSYNPATDTVTTLTGDEWPGDSAGTILPGGFAVSGNKLYILGGFNINVASTNQIWEFDPTQGVGAKWTQKVNTPEAIMYAPTTAIGGIIYVGGASDYSGGTVIDTTNSFSFNPSTNTIGTIALIPRATGETRGVVVGGQMWVLGGGRVAPNPSTEVDIYDPGTNTWSVGTPFTNARRNFPTDSDGTHVWLAGGYEPSTPAMDMEVFTPGAQCATPQPTATQGGATATPTCQAGGNFNILIVDSDEGVPPSTLQSQIAAEPGVASVDLFDAQNSTPTLAQLQPYTEVVVFSNSPFADPVGMGDVLADYQDGGGIVVATTFDWYGSPFGLDGRWMTGGYTPFTSPGTVNFATGNLGTYDTTHPLMQGVTTLTAFYRETMGLASGATQVAAWDDNTPLLAVKTTGGHTAVAISSYMGDSAGNWSGQFGLLIVNAARWLAGGGGCGTPQPTPTQSQATATPTCQAGGGGLPGPWSLVANGGLDVYGSASASDGTNAYFAGGYSFSGGTSTIFQKYNPATNTWTTLAPLPVAQALGSLIYSPTTNKLYLFGGEDPDTTAVYNTLYIYDVASNTWTTGAVMPDVRAFMASGYYNGHAYLVAGYSTGNVDPAFTQVWDYDIASGTYTTRASVPDPTGFGGAGSGVINGHLYVAGGRNINNVALSTLYNYDIAADSWTTGAAMPSGDNVPGSGVMGGDLFIIGGGNPFNGTGTNPKAAFATAPAKPAKGALPQTTGSKGALPQTTGSTVYYDPTTNTWATGHTLNHIRSFPGATNVGSTYLVTYGGYDGSSSTAAAEVATGTGGGCGTATPTPQATPTQCVANGVQQVLYDQYGAPATDDTSQDFETAFDAYDNTAADDFVVPSGQTWTINEVDAGGDVSIARPASPLFNVYIYQNNGGQPGTQVYSALSQTTGGSGSDYNVTLSSPAVLSAGSYWVSVQARWDFNTDGQWYWQNQAAQAGNATQWQNPGDGFGSGCTSWADMQTCLGQSGNPDQVYRLIGSSGGGGGCPSPTTPPATSTNTPTTPPSSTATTPPATVTTPPATATSPAATPTSPAATATSPAATVTSPPATVTSPPATNTPVGPTPTACTRQFRDVRPGSTYFQFIHCLFCLGIVDGYPDGTFRPFNNVTRGQLSKIVANSAGFHDTPTGQQFQDVPPSGEGSTFYAYIYRLVIRGYISGYPCGGPFEPCVPPDNMPYFRPNGPATRGQISKILSNAAGYNETPSGQQFQDVPPQGPGSTFYVYIYRLVLHNIIQGYPCGTVPQEPCIPPQNLPYFRPNNLATRGQMSKIDDLGFFPNCNIRARSDR